MQDSNELDDIQHKANVSLRRPDRFCAQEGQAIVELLHVSVRAHERAMCVYSVTLVYVCAVIVLCVQCYSTAVAVCTVTSCDGFSSM